MHVHASDSKLTEKGSATFFVRENGDTVVQKRGVLTDQEVRKIQDFIKTNYLDMYRTWSQISDEGCYRGEWVRHTHDMPLSRESGVLPSRVRGSLEAYLTDELLLAATIGAPQESPMAQGG